MAFEKDAAFSISLVGETTGEQWRGEFRALKYLPYDKQLLQDQKRRELLGPNGAEATVRAANQATMLSELFVRIVQAPKWWEELGRGLRIEDDNLALDLYHKCLEVETTHRASLASKAAEARGEIKAELAKAE